MSFTSINHASLAVSRLTGMWQDKAKFKAFIRMLASCADDFEAVLPWIAKLDDLDAKDARDVYLVIGTMMDVLGARMGQSRRITDALPVLLFGFDDDTDALEWSEDDPAGLTGGSWYEEGQSLRTDAVMDDATYRTALRMRRVKNATKTLNLETLITSLLYLFPDLPDLGTYALALTDIAGTVVLGIGRAPTQLEVALLRWTGAFPKPAGIELSCHWWTAGSPVFGFDDDADPDATGWAEEDTPGSGGTFAEEF